MCLSHNQAKATQMNVQSSLIQELFRYKFELRNNAAEANKIICRLKGAVDYYTVTWRFTKFRSVSARQSGKVKKA